MHINSLPSEPHEESREARERRIREDVRTYLGRSLHDKRIAIVHDPHHADVAAVRVSLFDAFTFKTSTIDFLWTDNGLRFSGGDDRLEEVEYTAWPPRIS
jgi:hypothetical protein